MLFLPLSGLFNQRDLIFHQIFHQIVIFHQPTMTTDNLSQPLPPQPLETSDTLSFKLISCHWPLSIHPENIRKPEVF